MLMGSAPPPVTLAVTVAVMGWTPHENSKNLTAEQISQVAAFLAAQ